MKPVIVSNIIIFIISVINLVVLCKIKEQTSMTRRLKRDFIIIAIGEMILIPLYLVLA